jgi:hypothetical protein
MFPENQRIAAQVRKNDEVLHTHARESDALRGAGATQGRDRRADARDVFEDDDSHDHLVAQTIAERIFASAGEGYEQDEDEAHAMPAQRYFARAAFNGAESEAKLVEALNDRCTDAAFVESGDPAAAASLQRMAQTAWIHYHHARAAAAGADGDAKFGPLADGAVTRAHRAALAIRRAARRAATRAAIRARAAARDRSSVPARLRHARRPVGLRSRPRAPSARRVRVSAISAAGSRQEEPGPQPERERVRASGPAHAELRELRLLPSAHDGTRTAHAQDAADLSELRCSVASRRAAGGFR